MSRTCDICLQEYEGAGKSYELRDDKHKVIEAKQGHADCVELEIEKIKNKLKKKKVK
jgi:hypothetical protein